MLFKLCLLVASRPPGFLPHLPAINHTPGKVCLSGDNDNTVLGALSGTLAPHGHRRDIPILSMLRTRLDWAQARQRVLAENVANSDTPNFRARDLAPLKFEDPTFVGPAHGWVAQAVNVDAYR